MAETSGNGDNSIPKGDDNELINRMAGHMAALMRELNLDLEDEMSAEDLLEAHGKSLDREAFDRGHSVHVKH